MKKLGLSLLLGVLVLSLVACANKSTDTDEENTLIVGMECNYAPLNWSQIESSEYAVEIDNNKGTYCDGYDVQIAKLIAADLGKDLVIRALDWSNLESGSAVNNGTVDLIIAGMNPTPTRAQSIDFSEAYYTSIYGIVVRKDSPYANATSLADFSGARIISQAGTVQDTALIDQISNVTHVPGSDNMPLAISAVVNNGADGAVIEKPVADTAISTNPNLLFITFADGAGFTVEESDSILAIGMKKDRTDGLLDDVNAALAKITDEQRNQLMDEAQLRQPAAE